MESCVWNVVFGKLCLGKLCLESCVWKVVFGKLCLSV